MRIPVLSMMNERRFTFTAILGGNLFSIVNDDTDREFHNCIVNAQHPEHPKHLRNHGGDTKSSNHGGSNGPNTHLHMNFSTNFQTFTAQACSNDHHVPKHRLTLTKTGPFLVKSSQIKGFARCYMFAFGDGFGVPPIDTVSVTYPYTFSCDCD